MSLPSVALCRQSNGRGKHRLYNANIRQALINALDDANIGQFIEPIRPQQSSLSPMDRRITAAKALIKQGYIGRSAKKLVEGIMANSGDATIYQQLQSLHPKCDTPLPPSPIDTKQSPSFHLIIDTNNDFKAFIRRLANGSSPGPSGWTFDLLAQSCDGSSQQCVVDTIALFIERLVNGTLPTALKEYLLPSNLVAISKPNGGIRPIAVGEIFWRLAADYILKHQRDNIKHTLEPNQFGCAVPGGIEHVIHTLQCTLEDTRYKCAAVSLDFTNAFNTLDRAFMLEQLYQQPKLKALWNITAWGYSSSSTLYVMDNTPLQSHNGARQGDPLGCILFANAIAKALQCTIKPTNGLIKCYAVLDDIRLAGPPHLLRECVDRLVSELKSSHLSLNPSKSELFWLHKDQLPTNLTNLQFRIIDKAATVLGTPVGVDIAIIQSILDNELAAHRSMFNILQSNLFTHQEAFLLLRYCTIPRLTHLMRTLRPQHLQQLATSFDQQVMDTVYHRLHLQYNSANNKNLPSQLLTLPIRLGGFGLRSTVVTSPIAYWSSIATSLDTINKRLKPSTAVIASTTPQLIEALTICTHKLPTKKGESKAPLQDILPSIDTILQQLYCHQKEYPVHMQHVMSTMKDEQSYTHIFNTAPPHVKATLNSTTSTNTFKSTSSAWIITYPTDSKLTIDNDTFELAARLRLGLPPPTSMEHISKCQCGDQLNDKWHFFSCSQLKRTASNNRHNHVVNIIAMAVREAGGMALVEPSGVSQRDARRPDIEIIMGSKHIYTDVTIRHPCSPSRIASAARSNKFLHAANVDKHTKYDKIANESKATFMCFAADTFGTIHEEALQLLDLISTYKYPNNDIKAKQWYRYLISIICISIARGNSFIISLGIQQCRATGGQRRTRPSFAPTSTYRYRSPSIHMPREFSTSPSS